MSDPDDETDDYQDTMEEIREELSDYNDSMSRCLDEGWFYADED